MRLSSAVLCLLLLLGCPKEKSPQPVRVAAAADLSVAFDELGRTFEHLTGKQVTFSYGSSGLLEKQLAEGAPFDVFAAANARFVDDAVAAGACDGATKRSYARGRLVLWWRDGIAPPASLAELSDARFRRLALANPEHAPYGQAAKEALTAAGLWDALKPRLVPAENVRQALQFAQSGNADAALVARALVAQESAGRHLDIDPSLHQPLNQALVVCTHGGDLQGGRAFADFVASPQGRAVLERSGFEPPPAEK